MEISLELENTSALGRRLKVQVPAANLQSRYDKRLHEVAKTARLDGFRVGKVNHSVLEKRFGQQVKEEILSKTLEETLQKALLEQNLRIAGQANLEKFEVAPLLKAKRFEQDLEYVAAFEVYPEIKVDNLSDIRLTKKQASIQDEDLDIAVRKVREHWGSWQDVSRPIQNGDLLKIKYESTIDGQPYEGSTAENIEIEIGNNRFIEGFEEGLLGKSLGETVDLDLQFPEDWRVATLAGKPVKFSITIETVQEKILAEFDDALAQRLKAASASEADIRAKIKENLEKELNKKIEAALRDQALEKVLAAHPFDLPEALVTEEQRFLHRDWHQQHGHDANTCHTEHEGLTEQARRRVSVGLLLGAVIKDHHLVLDPQLVKKRLREIAENFPESSYIETIYSQSEELMNSLRQTVITEQALDFLISQLPVDEEQTTVKELLAW